jgi:cytochrome c biogenesis protein CcmG/thiol:disulfide interchange protein DsbE
MWARPARRAKRCGFARLRLPCAAVTAAALALSVGACGSGSGGDAQGHKAPDYRRALAGAPPPLASLHRQANRLVPGGVEAFQARLKGLRGHPIVVNKWASWCGPCREEFPWFQDLAATFGKRVAFLGVNSNDSSAAARTFLGEFPVPYPSYSDPDQEIARTIRAAVGFPGTAFYDRAGKLVYVRQGQYPSKSALAADIRRYAR